MTRGYRAIAVAFVIACACIAGIVSADDESDRASLIREIDDLLGSAASDLRSASSGSAGYVEQARSRVQQVLSKLSALERVKGSDSTASNYVSRYPRYVEDFDRAARPLVELKNTEKALSELPRRCQDLDRQLQEQAQRFERDKDGEKIEELRRLALDVGGKAEDWWRDADQKRDQMSRWADEAKRFSVSDDKWSYVTSALQDTTARGFDAFMRDHREADNACKDLRQKDRHPVIERVLRELSNTAKGKDGLYAQLEDKLKRTEAAIKDLAGDRSNGKLSDARGYMSEIERLVRDVDQVKGTDRKANQIASQWPDYVKAFAPVSTALLGLKDAQFNLDEAPGKCDAAARQLSDTLKTYVDNKDPDGLVEGPKLAGDLGEKYTRALAAMENQRSTLRSLVSTAGGFDARDDRWSPLRRQIKESADKMYEYWDRKTQEVHKQCDDLAKGTRNPVVERFLNDLGAKAQSELKSFQDLAKAWEQDARDIYTLDCKQMQDLWDAWCSVEIEPNEDPEIGPVAQKTAEIIDASSRKIDAVLARLTTLRSTGRSLGTKAKYRDAIDAINREFEKQEKRLDRLKRKNGDWRGNNNPAVQFTKTFGQQAHDRMGSQFRCQVYDQSGYPGLGKGRPDCVVVNGKNDCWVYEFKPKGWNGENPLPRYIEAVEKYYTQSMQGSETPASNLGGSSFQMLVEANCRADPAKDKKNDRIKFQSALREYDRCEFHYECPE